MNPSDTAYEPPKTGAPQESTSVTRTRLPRTTEKHVVVMSLSRTGGTGGFGRRRALDRYRNVKLRIENRESRCVGPGFRQVDAVVVVSRGVNRANTGPDLASSV